MYNWLRPNGFRLVVKELPNVSFTCQVSNFPGLQAGSATQPTSFIDLPKIGDKLYHDDLQISFILDEDLANYTELYDWMIGITFPKDYQQFSLLKNRGATQTNDPESIAYSDMTLSILDSNNNASIDLMFKDAFPVSLRPSTFNVKDDSVEYMLCDASFRFSMFDIVRL